MLSADGPEDTATDSCPDDLSAWVLATAPRPWRMPFRWFAIVKGPRTWYRTVIVGSWRKPVFMT